MRAIGTLLIVLLGISLPAGTLAYPDGGGSFIGLFTDQEATSCTSVLTEPFAMEVLYVVASINTGVIADLESVVFKIGNLPPILDGLISGDWTGSDSQQGHVSTELILQWIDPLPGPLVLLGTLTLQPYVEGWLGDDHLLNVVAGDLLGDLVISDGSSAFFSVAGGVFTFNCTGVCECSPSTFVGESSWGRIKALY